MTPEQIAEAQRIAELLPKTLTKVPTYIDLGKQISDLLAENARLREAMEGLEDAADAYQCRVSEAIEELEGMQEESRNLKDAIKAALAARGGRDGHCRTKRRTLSAMLGVW